MSNIELVAAVALGVAIAVVCPTLYRYVRKQFPPEADGALLPTWMTAALTKYGALFVFSLLTAVVLIGVYRTANPDTVFGFGEAVALGFGFEASLEKFVFPKTDSGSRAASDSSAAAPRRVGPTELGK
ncbi:hypothetical protein [Lentzea sp. NPDC092896]|uniref:hypothetical protein n=1 Tax=Lentzea sp. NPDC092896 TaxID=3364127 RepID=UPI0038156D2D